VAEEEVAVRSLAVGEEAASNARPGRGAVGGGRCGLAMAEEGRRPARHLAVADEEAAGAAWPWRRRRRPARHQAVAEEARGLAVGEEASAASRPCSGGGGRRRSTEREAEEMRN
jgi:hypothetical protein